MTAVRRHVLGDAVSAERYLAAAVSLGQELTSVTAASAGRTLARLIPGFRFRGIEQRLSVWDLFVIWHWATMQLPTVPSAPMRNQAHGGPVFLPWHRMFLLRMEQQLQRVSGDPDAGLPYWDWAVAGGDLPPSEQLNQPLWSDALLGPARGEVDRGPLAGHRVRVEERVDGLWSIPPRALQRAAATRVARLPRSADVDRALGAARYDRAPWDSSVTTLRNLVEGWIDGPQLHNRVHVWVAGDMLVGTSPNDPVFYLNHANVDRIWESWMAAGVRTYEPAANEPGAPSGHRLDDAMVALLGAPQTPRQVLDPNAWYAYDTHYSLP